MGEVSIIGLDLAKNAFQAYGAAPDGTVVFRRKLARGQVLKFFASQPGVPSPAPPTFWIAASTRAPQP